MSQKYVIYYKKTISPKSQFMNKHIYLTNKGFNTDKSHRLTQSNPYCITIISHNHMIIHSYSNTVRI